MIVKSGVFWTVPVCVESVVTKLPKHKRILIFSVTACEVIGGQGLGDICKAGRSNNDFEFISFNAKP